MPSRNRFQKLLSMVFVGLVAVACSSSSESPESGAASTQGSDSPAAYEASTRISVEYDEATDELRLAKPATAQCFWIQMWSAESTKWETVASIPDNGRTVADGGVPLFEASTSPLASPIDNPGCEDNELAPATLWDVPFVDPTPGYYRICWLEEGEYTEFVLIS